MHRNQKELGILVQFEKLSCRKTIKLVQPKFLHVVVSCTHFLCASHAHSPLHMLLLVSILFQGLIINL